jgi:pyruvate dehydrogenase E2 component (dihydrolipoamide acetyltransferase)
MATEIIMPKVDMVMESGTFVEWLSEEGDRVEKGQPLFVIMTEKAAIEIEAPASGILSGVRAKPDDVIPVTQTIAYILDPGEKLPSSAHQIASPAVGEKVLSSAGKHLPLLAAEDLTPSTQPELSLGKVRATPVARRMAAHLGVELKAMQGLGPRGRIHKADVLRAADQKTLRTVENTPTPFSISPPLPAFPDVKIPLPDARQKKVIPLTGPRKIIAERMAYSAMLEPHITLTVSVDMTEAARLRSRGLKRLEDKTGYRLSFTAIIARVVARVLGNHPLLNASLAGDKIIAWEDVHLGIATHINDYLVVPVIREAQTKTLEQVLSNLGDLLEGARSKKLSPAEMSGSTFTISNLGMFGIESFTAIINPPESAILAVGAIVDRYVKVDQAMAERPVMKMTVSADHRVVDGVAAAHFINEVKSILENPYLLI